MGEWENSNSPYGTFDQGGNVWEWNESAIGSHRGVRGGSFGDNAYPLHALCRNESALLYEGIGLGFRVASNEVIPEPSTLIIWSLLGTLGITVGWWRRRRRC